MLRRSAFNTSLLLVTGVVLQACNRPPSTVVPNLSEYGSQVQGASRFELETRGQDNGAPPTGILSLWSPSYEGMKPLVQAKIDQTLEDLIDRFESRYNQVDVIWKKYSDSNIYKRYSNKIKDGLGPDLLLIHNFMIPELSKRKEIASIPQKSINTDQIRKKLLLSSRINSELYAIPFIVNVQLLCYNKQKVKEAPKSFQELMSISQSGVSTAIGGNFLQTIWGLPGFNATIFGEREICHLDERPDL